MTKAVSQIGQPESKALIIIEKFNPTPAFLKLSPYFLKKESRFS